VRRGVRRTSAARAGTTERIVTPILHTAAEVAELLRCSERTVRRMVQRGDLPGVRTSGGAGSSRLLIPAKAVADFLGSAR